MNLYLTFNSSNLEEKAKKLSIDLQLQIIDSKFLSSKDYEEDYFLVCSNEVSSGCVLNLSWATIYQGLPGKSRKSESRGL